MNVNINVSDLFFNHQHDHYDNAVNSAKEDGLDCYGDEARSALLIDAAGFLGSLSSISSVAIPTAEELVADFYSRL